MNFLLIFFTFFKAANTFTAKQKALLETISTVSFMVAVISGIAFLIAVLPALYYPYLSLAFALALVVYFTYIMYTINLTKFELY